MNAAARLVHQNLLSRRLILTYLLTRMQIAQIILAVAVLVSALSTIYVTHLNRVLHADYQHSLMVRNNLHVEQGQLLLERSTLIMQARTQQIAENKLMMIFPNHKSVVVIHE